MLLCCCAGALLYSGVWTIQCWAFARQGKGVRTGLFSKHVVRLCRHRLTLVVTSPLRLTPTLCLKHTLCRAPFVTHTVIARDALPGLPDDPQCDADKATVSVDKEVAACVGSSTWSASGKAPCAPCAATATCGTAGVKTACNKTADLVCDACAAATFSASGNGPCADCAVGKWSEASSTTCTSCISGKSVAAGKGGFEASCVDCAKGSFASNPGSACTTCAANSTCGAAGVKTACAPGSDTVCNGAVPPCVGGTSFSETGKEPCTTCAAASTCGAAGVKTECNTTADTVCDVAAFTATCGEITDGGAAFTACKCISAKNAAGVSVNTCRVYDSTKAAATPPSDAACCKTAECKAGTTFSVSGYAPCTPCTIESTCGAGGVKVACGASADTVCNSAGPADPAFDHSIPWTKGFSGDAADQTMDVKSGEVLKFVWSGGHNVFLMKDKAAFDACDFSGGTNLGGASPVYHTMGAATTYFACKVGAHCLNGQKLSAVITT